MDCHYRVLGLSRGAAEMDVKRAYRAKALLLHPDRNPTGAEAFKALQQAYEAVLVDVKRGNSRLFNAGLNGAAAAATGAAHRYARAYGTGGRAEGSSGGGSAFPSYPSPPSSLFSDTIPGGWRDVGAPRYRQQQGGSASSNGGSGAATGSPGTAAEGTTTADARWRSAHGSRVPVSAYDGAGGVPPPPMFSSGEPPSSSTNAANSAASSTEARWKSFLAKEHPWKPTSMSHPSPSSSAAASPSAPPPPPPPPPPPHPHPHSPTASSPAGGSRSSRDAEDARLPPSSTNVASKDAEEAREDLAYREAMFLHHRLHELSADRRASPITPAMKRSCRTEGEVKSPKSPSPAAAAGTVGPSPQFAASSSDTPRNETKAADTHGSSRSVPEGELAKEESLSRKESGKGATLRRQLHRADDAPLRRDGQADSNEKPEHARRKREETTQVAQSSTLPPLSSMPPMGGANRGSSAVPASLPLNSHSTHDAHQQERQVRDLVHRENILEERRLLQRQFLRYTYTPKPAEVGDMSDMEVFLLSEVLEDTLHKVQGVLEARLSKGPCSSCTSAPRALTQHYFLCSHASVCEGCHTAGVSRCPICGARAAADKAAEATSDAATPSRLPSARDCSGTAAVPKTQHSARMPSSDGAFSKPLSGRRKGSSAATPLELSLSRKPSSGASTPGRPPSARRLGSAVAAERRQSSAKSRDNPAATPKASTFGKAPTALPAASAPPPPLFPPPSITGTAKTTASLPQPVLTAVEIENAKGK